MNLITSKKELINTILSFEKEKHYQGRYTDRTTNTYTEVGVIKCIKGKKVYYKVFYGYRLEYYKEQLEENDYLILTYRVLELYWDYCKTKVSIERILRRYDII